MEITRFLYTRTRSRKVVWHRKEQFQYILYMFNAFYFIYFTLLTSVAFPVQPAKITTAFFPTIRVYVYIYIYIYTK